MKVSDFDFELPNELIAQHPLENRDASRMLVVNGQNLKDQHITDFISYLQPGDVVVFNNSKVIPARFDATAADGTKYEITLHTKEENPSAPGLCGALDFAAATNCGQNRWWGLSKKFQKLQIGETMILDDGTKIYIIAKNDDSGLLLTFDCDDEFAVLERIGKMPLPPYMKRSEEITDRDRYQTVYAEPVGSMAAPTAGLHFTQELIAAIRDTGAKIVNITLHVGAGTWMPVKTDDTSKHKMHSEWGCITPDQADTINNAKRVIAVGTTSLRLLESAARQKIGKRVAPFCGATDIFITPGYKFRAVDVLLTNFHLPKSTLFMLVSAFAGLPIMRAAYEHAATEKYRFFSYGDCCLLFNH
ncbi:MAG: tRNA preQ1(34) S-adenosylmethionine ribosyltransferase-isomerase QueA [Rickettsiales bacterium]|jgi:S-adenosylmethionine:tRNA ribosyltransferase-isomerase|nr:tRNA preQ1(34) S-adenosylmethionine ribosyltransferase-isomerase QueA [Rickettsiales bacterium]